VFVPFSPPPFAMSSFWKKLVDDKSDPATHSHYSFGELLLKGLGKLTKYPLPVPEDVRPWQEIGEYIDTLETLDLIVYSCPISWYSMELQGGRWIHGDDLKEGRRVLFLNFDFYFYFYFILFFC